MREKQTHVLFALANKKARHIFLYRTFHKCLWQAILRTLRFPLLSVYSPVL